MTNSALEEATKNKKILPTTQSNCENFLSLENMPRWAKESILELIESENWTELNDRFFRDITLGTGGMRGRTIGKTITKAELGDSHQGCTPKHAAIGTNTLNEITILRATKALYKHTTHQLSSEGTLEQPRLVVAHDVRHFSSQFSKLVASAWKKMGGFAMIFNGPRSTPQLSFTVRERYAHAGVVITASHNPYHDNGFKAYFSDGGQLVPPHADKVIASFNDVNCEEILEWLEELTCDEEYVFLKKEDDLAYTAALEEAVLSPDLIKENSPRIIFSPIHGTGSIATIPSLLDHGVEVKVVKSQNTFDPNFSSVKSPNPENKEALSAAIEEGKKAKADAIIGSDPDCDRIGVAIRKEGDFVCLSGNQVACLLAEYRLISLKSKQLLMPENRSSFVLLKTFVTTPLLEKIALGHGINFVNTPTGFKWMAQKISSYEKAATISIKEREGIGLDYDQTDLFTRIDVLTKYSKYVPLAAEESYGYLPLDLVRDKDGNASSLAFAEVLAYLKSLSITPIDFLDKLYLKYGFHHEKTENLFFEGAEGSEKIIRIMDSFRKIPFQQINGIKIKKIKDFSQDDLLDEEDMPIARENFLMLALENGFKIAIRPSGTEPKIKFYIFGESTPNSSNLELTKEKIIKEVEEIGTFLSDEANRRASKKISRDP